MRVSFVVFRRRLITDHDNLVGGLKHLRDAVAAWLGVDDGDTRITWEYGQVETKGPEGTVVKVSLDEHRV